MSLKKEFQEFLANKPVPPYATLPDSGIDVEWSELMKAWKVDMGMSVEEFLKRNPDIKANIIKKYPDLASRIGENITNRTIMKRGLAEAILSEMLEATDVPDEADRVFKGQRLRNIASGTLTAEARNELYENAQKTGQLPNRTTINPEGGVRQSSLRDLSNYPRKGGVATRKAKELNLTEYKWKDEIYRLGRDGDRWVTEEYDEGRKFSETRASLGHPNSRLESQLRKEGKRHRGLEHSSPEEAELSWLKKKEIMKYNADNNLKPGDPLYRRIEHRIQVANHDFWNSPLGKSMGKPDDGWNIIWTNKAQYDAKGSLEAKLKGFPYVVDVEPVSGNLRVIGFDEFNRNFDATQGLEIGLDSDMKEVAFGFKTEAEEKALKQLDFEKRSVGAAGRDFPLAPSSGRGMLQRRLGAVLPVVGAGFDAWDVKARLAEARANPDNKLDQLQLGIASATLGTSFWAEPANFALGMTNLGIDAYRTITEEDKREDFLKSMRAIGRGGTKIGKQVTNLL